MPSPIHSPAELAALTGEDAAELRRRLAEAEGLRRMAVEVLETVDAEEVFRRLCALLPALLGADFAAVLAPPLDAHLRWCAEQAPAPELADRLDALMDEARRTGETRVAPASQDEADGQTAGPFGGASAVAVPLPGDGGADGALLVGWHGSAPLPDGAAGLIERIAGQAAAAFRNAARYHALTQAAVRRDRFFSAMSHDLRTPITAIVGYSELLQDGIMGALGAKQQEMVERICQVSGHLSQLVNDILDLAKLDAGRMEFHRESVALGDLVDEALVTVEPQAAAKRLELRLEIDAHREQALWVDPPRVRQVLVNLLSNAVKFTERGSVRVTAGVGDDGLRWIEVRDTGPGIPPGSEEAVFEEFLQIAAGTKTKREPGSGLGLAISRRMARAMGGDLTAHNVEDGGAAFTLYLPTGEGEAAD